MAVNRSGLRLLVLMAIIVGLCSIGQLAIDIIEFYGQTLLPEAIARAGLGFIFWLGFALLIVGTYKYGRLAISKDEDIEIKAIGILALVIAITQLGQYAVSVMNLVDNIILPDSVAAFMLHGILYIGVFYMIFAAYLLKKI